jgi:hypothetical protein
LRRDLQARIDRALPALQARARQTNKTAVRLLLDRTPTEEGMRPPVGV